MMAYKFKPAKEVASTRIANGVWIDHGVIKESDFEWLQTAERLMLWNVKIPDGFLAKLPKLWWLDIRGGTAENLSVAKGCTQLKYFTVRHIRGLSDISEIANFKRLQLLMLYAAPQVITLPSLRQLEDLARIELGNMAGLQSLVPFLDAPNLKELLFRKKMRVSAADVQNIKQHPSLEKFNWDGLDVPVKDWEPVVKSVNLPPPRSIYPEEWFGLQ
jgi:hypothetical protein